LAGAGSAICAGVASRRGSKERASAAEKRSKELATKIAALEKRLEQLAREKEDLRRASLPPPPAQDEEVLQMLEPVLTAKIQ